MPFVRFMYLFIFSFSLFFVFPQYMRYAVQHVELLSLSLSLCCCARIVIEVQEGKGEMLGPSVNARRALTSVVH